jgi:uncharacterized protein
VVDSFLRFILKYPRLIVAGCLFIVAALGANIIYLEIDPSIKGMLPDDFPAVVDLNRFEDEFSASELILVAIKTDDPLADETLAELAELQTTLESLTDVERVMSVFSVKYLEAQHNNFKPRDLIPIDTLPLSAEQTAELRTILRSDDLYLGNVISNDMKTLAFLILPDEGFDDKVLSLDVERKTRELFGEAAMITGLPHTRTAVTAGMQGDLRTFMPIGIIFMILLLVLSFRTWLGAILPLLVVIMSVISTFGLMALLGEKLRMITLIMPVMLIAVANDYGIHLVAHYLGRLSSHPDEPRTELVYRVARALGIPIVGAGITTVVGFLTLTTHVIPAARWAGILAAFGVVMAFLFSLTFVPAMLVLLKPPPEVISKFSSSLLTRSLVRFRRFLRGHGIKAVVLCFVLAAIAALGLPNLTVDTDPVHYFHKADPIRQANEFVNSEFGGSAQLNVMVEGDIKNPGVLSRMRELQDYLETLPMVSQTQSVVNTVERMNRAFHNDDPEFEKIPETRNAVAQFLLLYSFQSDLSDFDHFVDFEYTNAQISARVNSTSSSALEDLIQKANLYIDKNLNRAEFTSVTGFVTILGSLVQMMVEGQLISLVVSLILVFLIAAILFRSIIGGIFIAAPLVLAVIVVFGLMGHFNIELNIATAMLASIVVGVGVDYIIHFLWHYREHLQECGDPWEAVDLTLHISGRGIIVNALSVIVGFSVMLVSNFLPIFFFGFLLTISISTCLLAAMLILPVLVATLQPKFLLEAPRGVQLASDEPLAVPLPALSAVKIPKAIKVVTRGLVLSLVLGLGYALYVVGINFIEWAAGLQDTVGIWAGIWEAICANGSIIAALHVIICLNSSGLAEFKYGRSFTRAFILSLLITPPVMLKAWATARTGPASR